MSSTIMWQPTLAEVIKGLYVIFVNGPAFDRGQWWLFVTKCWLSVSHNLLVNYKLKSVTFDLVLPCYVRPCVTVTPTSLTPENVAPLQISNAPSVIAPCTRPILSSPYLSGFLSSFPFPSLSLCHHHTLTQNRGSWALVAGGARPAGLGSWGGRARVTASAWLC